jgi:hypothetical protein
MAEVVITPPVGVRMSGYRDRTAGSTGVLDDLFCKALVLDDGRRKLAVIVLDVLGLSRSICSAIRSAVARQTGIETGDVMVSAIHTHCGPDIDRLPESSVDHLVAQAAGAAAAALAGIRDARLGTAQGECRAGVNRRNPRSPRMPHHLYSWPEGTMDPRVVVLAVQDREGVPLGAVVNYACHPVALGWNELNLSKDWVEHTCRVLKAAWGSKTVPVFLQGCAGNINPSWIYDKPDADPVPPPDWPDPLEDRLREVRRIGHMVGGEALKAASSIMRWTEDATLDARLVEVRLPVRPDLPPSMLETGEESRPAGRYPGLRQRLAKAPREITTDIHVVRIGPWYLVGLPGEILIEYQIELREKISSPAVLVSELAGDSIGYVPTPAAVKEGGYEPGASYVTPEAGSILVRAVLDALRSMPA